MELHFFRKNCPIRPVRPVRPVCPVRPVRPANPLEGAPVLCLGPLSKGICLRVALEFGLELHLCGDCKIPSKCFLQLMSKFPRKV